MFNSEALEVAIGMAFFFLFVSLVCTAVKEWLEGIFKWRAMDLDRALRTLLCDVDGTTTSQLLRHPLLFSLFPGNYDPAQLRSSWFTPGTGSLHMRFSHRRHLPSYIPTAQFVMALIDCVARGPISASSDETGSPGFCRNKRDSQGQLMLLDRTKMLEALRRVVQRITTRWK